MKKSPLVSVVIPTYKRSDMLPRAIESVLCQTYNNVQVVIVDDNNPDTEWRKKTEDLMQHYKDNQRVKYVKHEKNRNGSVARNSGIIAADGEIIAFLDDDDIYYPTKIEKQVEYLLSHKKERAVYCGWDREGIVIPDAVGDCSYELLSGESLIYTNTIMMWKREAIKCGGWDVTFKRHQEAAFMLRYFKKGGKIGIVPECLVKFDTSDRMNAASNGVMNEQYMEHYLLSYSDIIEKLENNKPGTKKEIYAQRYRGVFLAYIKYGDLLGAARIWKRMTRNMPIKFNVLIIEYLVERIFKRRKNK